MFPVLREKGVIQAATATIRRTLEVFRTPTDCNTASISCRLEQRQSKRKMHKWQYRMRLTANFDSAKCKKMQEGTRLDQTRDQLRNSRNYQDFRRENGLV